MMFRKRLMAAACTAALAGLAFNPAAPDFSAPLADLGAGAVDTAPTVGTGSATFVRATTRWTRLSSGLLAEIASGVAGSYYLADLSYGGYLSEGTITNIVLHSNDFTNVAWTLSNMTAAKTATGPDGVVNSASTLTATGANGTALQAIVAGSASRHSTTWIKRRTGTGTVNITQDNGTTWTVVAVTAGWTQVPSTQQTLANPTVGIRVVTSGDEVDVWCFMNVQPLYEPMPVPTTTAAVTKNADSLTYQSAGNVLAAQGTCFATGHYPYAGTIGTDRTLVSGGGSGTFLGLNGGTAVTTIIIGDGTSNTEKSALSSMATAARKRASSWGSSAKAVTGDGAAVASGAFDGAMTVVNISVAAIHQAAVKDVKFWLAKASDAQLATLTA